MARILLLILLLLPVARPALPETPADVRLQYIERDLDRLRDDVKTRPDMESLLRLEAEIPRLRAEIEKAGKALDDSVKGKLDLQDKRIGDLHASVTRWGTIVPVLLAIIAALGAWKLQSDQKKSVKEWFEKEGKMVAEEVVRNYVQSDEGNQKLGQATATALTPQINEIINKLAADRGPDLAKDHGAGTARPLPSSETQAALEAVLKQPEDQRSPEAWKALIYSYSETKRYEAALALADQWLAALMTTPEQTAQALLAKGNVKYDAGRVVEAIATYDDLLTRFSGDPDQTVRAQVAWALVNKGVTLGQLTPPQWEAAIAAYDDVIQRFGSDPAPALREQVAMALVNKGVALTNLTPPQSEAAIAAYNDVIQRFGSDPAPAMREQVAKALVNKGVTFGRLTPPQREAEIAVYDDVIQRFGSDPAPALREPVAKALRNKGVALGRLTPPQWEAEIAAYNDVIQRFGSDPAPALCEQVAKALVNKGITLGELTPPQLEAAIAAYNDVIQRFGSDPAPALREQVAKALVNKGYALTNLTPPQSEAAIAAYNDVIQRFGSDPAPALREQVARALHYKAITLIDLNRFADARAVCEDYIHRFADAPETAIQEMTTKVRSLLGNLPPPEPSADS